MSLVIEQRGKCVTQEGNLRLHRPGLLCRFGLHWFCRDELVRTMDIRFEADDGTVTGVSFALSSKGKERARE